MLLGERGSHDEHGGGELAVWPQAALVHQFGPAGRHELTRVRLGQPAAIDLARLELLHRDRVLLRLDVHVAAALGVRLEAVLQQEVAQRDVLRVSELRGRERLALERGYGGDPLFDDQRSAARGRA